MNGGQHGGAAAGVQHSPGWQWAGREVEGGGQQEAAAARDAVVQAGGVELRRRVAGRGVQAACEILTTAGVRLSKSERPETRKKLEEVMRSLERIGTDTKGVAARIRFVIRDVLVRAPCLRPRTSSCAACCSCGCVPRRVLRWVPTHGQPCPAAALCVHARPSAGPQAQQLGAAPRGVHRQEAGRGQGAGRGGAGHGQQHHRHGAAHAAHAPGAEGLVNQAARLPPPSLPGGRC